MRMSLNNRIFFGIIMFSLMACSKGGDTADDGGGDGHIPSPIDVTAPQLTVYTPTTSQVFTSGTAINVTGKITDDLGLYQGSIRITDDATGQLLMEQLYVIHYVLSYDFNISYTPMVSSTKNYTVTVYFEDHGYNAATKSVKITVNP